MFPIVFRSSNPNVETWGKMLMVFDRDFRKD